MSESVKDTSEQPGRIRRLTPRAGVRVQLFSAAAMWAIGASILLVRGIGFLHDSWFLALLAFAVALGTAKSHLMLDRVARKAVQRIQERGRACYFGFFSWKSWLFVIVMMGGGILLRRSGLPPDFLAVIYVGVGTGLVIADRIFWQAFFSAAPAVKSAAPGPE